MTGRVDDREDAFEPAREIADTVIYEGHVLYPYRASDAKNQMRWQWGVLVPPCYSERDPSERSWSRTECLLEGEDAKLAVRVRFLQMQQRGVQAVRGDGFEAVRSLDVGDVTYLPWDEAVDQAVDLDVNVGDLLEGAYELPFTVEGGVDVELLHDGAGEMVGRLVRERQALSGVVRVECERLPGPYGVARLRIGTENVTERSAPAERTEALRGSFVAAHVLLHAAGGRFVSLLDPPEWAKGYAEQCENVGTFPVLAGEEPKTDLMLSSPIILYDHPRVAPESAATFMDSTEIDELLSLRTLTLTDQEKREARGTDARASALIDHVEDMPPELMDRLHGAVRYLAAAPRRVDQEVPTETTPDVPWWDPGSDASVSPEKDCTVVAGAIVRRGSKVVLRPGSKRADAQDMFLDGRPATVAAVLFDVDGDEHLAVSLDDDPEATEIQQAHGRYLYFAPEEVEPVETP